MATDPIQFQPPPTWAPVALTTNDPATGAQQQTFNPVWLKWFLDLTQIINDSGGSAGILHNDTGSLQGGQANQYYHLTSAEYTGSGTGVFARVTSPVFTTPNLGTPSVLSVHRMFQWRLQL